MGIDPTVVTFLLVFVPVILVVGIAFLAVKLTEWNSIAFLAAKLTEWNIWRAARLISRLHRSSESSEASSSPGHSDYSDASTLVGSKPHDVEKG